MPSSFHNKTLQYTLLFSFALACIILVCSHNAVVSRHHQDDDNDDKKKLLSVPLPPQIIRKAATGGLPPIPDFVKQKLHHDNQEDESKTIPSFSIPSDAVSETSKVTLQPTFGSHRDTNAVVFAFAEGYDLNVYITFIESLKSTGFKGDVVLSISHIDGMKNGVEEYLRWYSQQPDDTLNVISYALQWECYKKSGTRILPTNNEGRGSTTNHGFSDCKIHGLYSSGEDNRPADDPRDARPVATARYELYWIWSKQYTATSSILIVDVRDTFFQSNPFTFTSSSPPSLESESCKLDLFEENFAAVDIGRSQYNSRWIKSAYGQNVLKLIEKQPVICSGSTMGTQFAIELYSMAMVAQFDRTKCKQVGCDQGFHNYLYYEGGLRPYLQSHECSIRVHKQGDGTVNNLAALRNSPLREQGVLKTIEGHQTNPSVTDNIVVLNNDGSTLSPVVHQFDRDKELKVVIRKRTTVMLAKWKSNQATAR